MPHLDIQHLSYRYPENQRFHLQSIHLSLEKGQIMALVGESGSGKTTLLQLLAGLLDATEGSIYLDGKKVTGPAHHLVPGHPDIKVIFQHFGLSPKISVYQNIAYLLKAYVPEYREERTREMLRICKLEGKENSMPHELSGGEKQRLAIARALAEDPQLLLMDEPFSNMDAILKNQLREDIIDILKETGITAIVVSHDMHDALAVADQIAVIRHGRLLQTGTPQHIYTAPQTPYTAQLFGSCNFLNSRQCKAIFNINAGEAAAVGIRAEHIQLSQSATSCMGTVVRRRFMGAYHELSVSIQDVLLLVQVFGQDQDFREGSRVCVTADQAHLLLFQADSISA